MTKKEFFQNIMNNDELNDEITEFARAEFEKLEATSRQRRKSAEEKMAAKAPIRDALVGCLTSEPKTASMLIAESGLDITHQSVPSLLKSLIPDAVIKTKIKVAGKGYQVGYSLAENAASEEAPTL